ncbi:MAG: hypothetical protein U9P00_13155 [Pseudomonadota bacterium]|nr:hypothetical protein [Pseudomonadota bacterium]
MNLNGIWSSDLGGVYGWEPIGTMFLKDGHITGGGRNHYTVGTYKTKGDSAVFHMEIAQYGKKRALFGQKSEQVCVVVKARRNGDKMIGEAPLPGHMEYGLCVRFKRRGDLPEEKAH